MGDDANGTQIGLYYNFRVKGAYGTEWDYYPFLPDGQSSNTYGGPYVPHEQRPSAPAFSQSNAENTTVTIKIPGVWRVPQSVPLDVQVQSITGYMYYRDKQYHFIGQYSDWSNTQTITIGGSTTPTTTNTPSSQNSTTSMLIHPIPENAVLFGLSWGEIAIAAVLITIALLLILIVVVFAWKNKK